jgi:hypothetical protein
MVEADMGGARRRIPSCDRNLLLTEAARMLIKPGGIHPLCWHSPDRDDTLRGIYCSSSLLFPLFPQTSSSSSAGTQTVAAARKHHRLETEGTLVTRHGLG